MITRTTRSIGWSGDGDILCLHFDGTWQMYIMNRTRIHCTRGGWSKVGKTHIIERVASVFPDIKLEVMKG